MWEWGEVKRKRTLRRNGSNVVLLTISPDIMLYVNYRKLIV